MQKAAAGNYACRLLQYRVKFSLQSSNVSTRVISVRNAVSANTIHRMKKGEAITTKTLDALCYVLDCDVQDIVKFERE